MSVDVERKGSPSLKFRETGYVDIHVDGLAWLRYPQCACNGDITVLHKYIDACRLDSLAESIFKTPSMHFSFNVH